MKILQVVRIDGEKMSGPPTKRGAPFRLFLPEKGVNAGGCLRAPAFP